MQRFLTLNKLEFLETFQNELSCKFKGTQNWWTKSLFHFTDILNAVSIINNKHIFSRAKTMEFGLMKNDNANDDVIYRTCDEYKQYVRLYFGPSTPTQKNNEGIKPKEQIVNNAHCPIPIMFVFDFKKIFMLNDIKFTDGNLAKNPNIYNSIFDLTRLNFNLIYHRSWFYPEDRDVIINSRHSEVLIKDYLNLDNNLRLIATRSEAEKETLIYMLPDELKIKYQNKIYVQPQTGIFINDWLYVNKVSIVENQIHIDWHKCSNSLHCESKYDLLIEAKNIYTGNIRKFAQSNWYPAKSKLKINLPMDFNIRQFELSIKIDDIISYHNLLYT